ncbi:MAG: class I SAM-dependent methyltransferase [Armatimonadota bacterium]
MSAIYQSPDWDTYHMVYDQPHLAVEPLEQEIAVVDGALTALQQAGMIPHTRYDHARFLAHRQAVQDSFEIPWTAITPRMQRLLYALNAITQPQNMIAAGIFCGNTFISNAGAAVGPGACYTAARLIGVEIKPEEAARAERNVRKIDPTGVAQIIAADAVEFVRDFPHPIHLFYLDADGDAERGKGIYYDILHAGFDRLPPGALILAHNSINCAEHLRHYLAYVRDGANLRNSVNVMIDGEGLEVTVK